MSMTMGRIMITEKMGITIILRTVGIMGIISEVSP